MCSIATCIVIIQTCFNILYSLFYVCQNNIRSKIQRIIFQIVQSILLSKHVKYLRKF